ncbi:putative sterol regulatory element-binding protein [Elsinoe fawcettii]|nr:putative sterol regulatory element-binding protein [Elsinoe fawcettii]
MSGLFLDYRSHELCFNDGMDEMDAVMEWIQGDLEEDELGKSPRGPHGPAAAEPHFLALDLDTLSPSSVSSPSTASSASAEPPDRLSAGLFAGELGQTLQQVLQPSNKQRRKQRRSKPPQCHRSIERRYRSKLVDLIDGLCQCVPTLRIRDEEVDDYDLDGLSPAKKFTKAVILEKTTEYIRHLEATRGQECCTKLRARADEIHAENERLQVKLDVLEERFRSLEQAIHRQR